MSTVIDQPKADALPAKGFGALPCPRCLDDAAVSVDLDSLGDFKCGSCDESFTAADLRNLIARWQAVLDWIDLAPNRQ